jgi:hypothetical protein
MFVKLALWSFEITFPLNLDAYLEFIVFIVVVLSKFVGALFRFYAGEARSESLDSFL